eukprot:3145876-Alexandrium_andersonii.AAC.1
MFLLKALQNEIEDAWAKIMLPPAAPAARPKWRPDRPNTACPSTPPRGGKARDWWQKERALAAASTPR